MRDDFDGPIFHGRRKGRPLRSGMKNLLANILPLVRFNKNQSLANQFDHLADLVLEIGFGGGEHLAGLAEANPKTNFIGAEPFLNGVASLLKHIQKRNLSNIRIWDDDVRLILPTLPATCLASVFIMFPDPWPKRRHSARRILQPEMMNIFSYLIRPGGKLVVASDDLTAKNWLLKTALANADFLWTARRPTDWREHPAHLPATRYMNKAIMAGRRPSWFIFERC